MDRRMFLGVAGSGGSKYKNPIYVSYIKDETTQIGNPTINIPNITNYTVYINGIATIGSVGVSNPIRSVQLYSNNTLVANLRPCLSTENGHFLEMALYDIIHNKYYYESTSQYAVKKVGDTINELDKITYNGTDIIAHYEYKPIPNYVIGRDIIPIRYGTVVGTYDFISGTFEELDAVEGNRVLNYEDVLPSSYFSKNPTCCFIDQREEITNYDPNLMIVEDYLQESLSVRNYEVNWNGTVRSLSKDGNRGSSSSNRFTEIKKHVHCGVGVYINDKLTIREISKRRVDDIRGIVFISEPSEEIPDVEGDKAYPYIENNEEYPYIHDCVNNDIFFELYRWIDIPIYYKVEKDKSSYDGTLLTSDFYRITVTTEIPIWDTVGWIKYDADVAIGMFEGAAAGTNGIIHSIYNEYPTQSTFNNLESKLRRGFSVVDYQTRQSLTYLFYGLYGSLICKENCGYGSSQYEKVGISLLNLEEDSVVSDDFVRFLQLENVWSNVAEYVGNLKCFGVGGEEYAEHDEDAYLYDYAAHNEFTVNLVLQSGDVVSVSDKEIRDSDSDFYQRLGFHKGSIFAAILDDNKQITRLIELNADHNNGCAVQLIFGKYADIIAKTTVTDTYYGHGFTAKQEQAIRPGDMFVASGELKAADNGLVYFTNDSTITPCVRIMYKNPVIK